MSRPLAVAVCAALMLLAAADAGTTLVGLAYHGAHEGNPVAAWLFAHIGVLPGVLLTQGYFAAGAALLAWAAVRRPCWMYPALPVAALLMLLATKSAVVAWNATLLAS